MKSIQASPGRGYSVAYNNLGVVLEREGLPDAAERAFITSIKIDDYRLAHANLGRIFLKREKIDAAVKALQNASKRHTRDPGIHFYLGVGYYKKGQKDRALKTFQYVDRLHPNFNNVRRIIRAIPAK